MTPAGASAPLLRAARNELERLARAASDVRGRKQALEMQLSDLAAELETLEARRDLLLQVTGESRPPSAPDRPAREVLRGRGLRRLAGRLLWQWAGERPVHYRELYEHVLREGYVLSGKDPAATFLTNLRESPAVVRGDKPGHYRLDNSVEAELVQRLAEIDAELADVAKTLDRVLQAGGSADAERLRRHQDQLVGRRRRVSADLAEVRDIFHEPEEESDDVVSTAPQVAA